MLDDPDETKRPNDARRRRTDDGRRRRDAPGAGLGGMSQADTKLNQPTAANAQADIKLNQPTAANTQVDTKLNESPAANAQADTKLNDAAHVQADTKVDASRGDAQAASQNDLDMWSWEEANAAAIVANASYTVPGQGKLVISTDSL